jgi:predicted transcriptional regulator
MPRKSSKTLTDAELAVMQVLWERGAATVAEVAEALSGDKPWAYNTVLTFLRILERKGYAGHIKHGRAFVYRPRVARGDARHKALRKLLGRFFDGSPELLVQNILEAGEMDPDELGRIRALLDEADRRPS